MQKNYKAIIRKFTKRQSDQVLDFIYRCGVNSFSFNVLNINETLNVVKIENQFMELLKGFRIKDKFIYNQTTIDLLKKFVIEGVLPNYFQKKFNFEDFVFFKNDTEFLATTTHEQIGILYMDEAELDEIKKLYIDFETVEHLQ